ncbi:MAG TPA: sugar phosphate isomerase/epimerase family protein [Caldilineaceae bacterium]|nr:sugar phosphate isomerase/epimerase family protein [Caldilineaceae bacterium]
MQLGFVSAILADLSGQEVLEFAAQSGFDCVEVMCWPKGKAERRYAGVTHIDVNGFGKAEAAAVQGWQQASGVSISALGYYPNPLTPDLAEAQVYIDHIQKVIMAAEMLEIGVVNTFIGRDWHRSIDDNWPRFLEVWRPLIAYAESHGVRIGIENCPMAFSNDEWPGGKNLAIAPAVWRRMFNDIPSDNFGLNFDPSHLVWQQIDIGQAIREFAGKFVHVHAKDARVDKHRLHEVGILGTPLQFHTPKLPGLGDVDWGEFYSHLSDAGYNGPVCIEVEDRAYEGSLERRKVSLVQSGRYLRQFMG